MLNWIVKENESEYTEDSLVTAGKQSQNSIKMTGGRKHGTN